MDRTASSEMPSNQHPMPCAARQGRQAIVADHHSGARQLFRTLREYRAFGGFGLLLGAMWIALFAIHNSLPGLQSGSDQVYRMKINYIATGDLFPKRSQTRLAIFGNSQILSGFQPHVFDDLSSGSAASVNLGLPNATHFIDELEALVNRGEAPTHVMLTVPWSSEPAQTVWQRLHDDDWLMEQCFPFRKLPRNATLFLLLSRTRGGPLAYYQDVMSRLQQIQTDRGYHFIESQSHFPNHSLPEDYRLASDDPDRIEFRKVTTEGVQSERLKHLIASTRLRVFFVPSYVREGQLAPAPPNKVLADSLKSLGIEVLGPDYWVLPKRLFSDSIHLNPDGAKAYTTMLWTLFQSATALDESDTHPRLDVVSDPKAIKR